MTKVRIASSIVAGFLLAALALLPASAQGPTAPELLAQLRAGGLIVVLRHASSPREEPDAATANPDNPNHERQLDEAGRNQATALGEALKALAIPVGAVLSSPTYRARETVRLAGLPDPQTFEELATAGGAGGMAPDPGMMEARGAWLRTQCAQIPAAGTNTLIVTHAPNMAAAFSGLASAVEDGDALVFLPDGEGSSDFIGRIAIEEWPALAEAQ